MNQPTYDGKNGALLMDGKYVPCGSAKPCSCYGCMFTGLTPTIATYLVENMIRPESTN